MTSYDRVGIRHELARRAAAGNPVRVGVSGAGWIGSGFRRPGRAYAGLAASTCWPIPTWPLPGKRTSRPVSPADAIVEASAVGAGDGCAARRQAGDHAALTIWPRNWTPSILSPT